MPPVQLYDMQDDPAEQRNVQAEHADIVKNMTALLGQYVAQGRSTPGAPQQNSVPVDIRK
jgi:hypothetical protein